MNILFFTTNECIRDEVQEYLKDRQGKAYFADNIEEAIALLHAHLIDTAVLDLEQMTDIRVLKYINKYFNHVRIVVAVERTIESAISTIRNSQFGILCKPFTLEELGKIVGQWDRREKDLV